ncbi:MAG: hypothetical protein R6V57_10825 [Vicinamibacterales bacterium]
MRQTRIALLTGAAAAFVALLVLTAPVVGQQGAAGGAKPAAPVFDTSDQCQACHNGLVTPRGADVSIGIAWRASMMANAARDPYWQAGVRREITQHPSAAAAIEHECSACHMPMMRYEAKAAGRLGGVFAHLPIVAGGTREHIIAADGVSCSACHQATPEKLGTRESFNAGFVVAAPSASGDRAAYGPFEVTPGLASVMRSATGFVPMQGAHMQSSDLCATCHTLITHSLGPDGKVVGELPEQVPYLEWRHSRYATEKSCQDCHMKTVPEAMPIASVLGEPRQGFRQHDFRGSNFFMPRLLNKYRQELGVTALPQELDAAALLAEEFLRDEAAIVSVEAARVEGGRVVADITVENRGGHKLPTAYPSRRAWLHIAVKDAGGAVVFESGRLEADGRIRGNDNDADGARYEAHHDEIASADDVQVYEPILGDPAGAVTTGLIAAVKYLKDNRILPHGFDKATASHEIAVAGKAAADPNFTGGSDRVRLNAPVGGAAGPFTVEVELLYQPIGYRWAQNLGPYKASMEPARFLDYYNAMGSATSARLAREVVQVK